jgi:hypothetical protein
MKLLWHLLVSFKKAHNSVLAGILIFVKDLVFDSPYQDLFCSGAVGLLFRCEYMFFYFFKLDFIRAALVNVLDNFSKDTVSHLQKSPVLFLVSIPYQRQIPVPKPSYVRTIFGPYDSPAMGYGAPRR